MRTAAMATDRTIYRRRTSYSGDAPAMVIIAAGWHLREPESREPGTGLLYTDRDRDVPGYRRPLSRGHLGSGARVPMLVLTRAPHRDDTAALVRATEALRATWTDGIVARDIRRTITDTVGEDAGRFLQVELVRPQHVRGDHAVTIPADPIELEG